MNTCPVKPVQKEGAGAGVGGGDSLEGETWLPSLEITSSHRLCGRNIKIQPDITQVFYHGLSDPIPAYHALHTLKHGYPFLDTLLTFKYKRRRGGATFSTRWKSFWWKQVASSFSGSNETTRGIMGSFNLQKHTNVCILDKHDTYFCVIVEIFLFSEGPNQVVLSCAKVCSRSEQSLPLS